MPITEMFNNTAKTLKIENLSNQCNGSRQLFTISESFDSASLRVYWNGMRQTINEIVIESSLTFSTSFIPASSAPLVVEYYTL
jgi:hypothetical protein